MINKQDLELLDIKLLPSQTMHLHRMWYDKYPYVDGPASSGRSYVIGVYVFLKLFNLYEGNKIVVTASSFRATKEIFEQVSSLVDKQQQEFHINRQSDKYSIKVGTNTCIFTPVGDGEKIRGFRPDILIIENSNIMDAVVKDIIVLGMTYPNHQVIQVVTHE